MTKGKPNLSISSFNRIEFLLCWNICTARNQKQGVYTNGFSGKSDKRGKGMSGDSSRTTETGAGEGLHNPNIASPTDFGSELFWRCSMERTNK